MAPAADRPSLRMFTRSDANWYTENLDSEVIRWSRENPVEDPESWWELTGSHRLGIECCGELVGSAKISDDDGRFEISYWVAANHRRRGIAAGALRLLTAEARNRDPNRPIELEIHPQNLPSISTAESAGYGFFETRESCDSCADEHGRVAVYRPVG